MAAANRHVQQELFRRGGARRGAARKPKKARAGESHDARPEFKSSHPLHVVMRVVPEVRSLRRRNMYKAIREASITAAMREWFRIVHISVQRSHVHMLVEAENKGALARGMQGFLISAARNINTALGAGVRAARQLHPDDFASDLTQVLRQLSRRGKVFVDRYHLEVITSPTQARHA